MFALSVALTIDNWFHWLKVRRQETFQKLFGTGLRGILVNVTVVRSHLYWYSSPGNVFMTRYTRPVPECSSTRGYSASHQSVIMAYYLSVADTGCLFKNKGTDVVVINPVHTGM